ncbi:MAG TPA: hypothetical protein VGI10_27765 [Polyangiaceae bacterium]
MAQMRVRGVLLVAGGTAFASLARAAEPSKTFTLDWSAPAGCPDKADVLARAEQLVGHSLNQPAGAQPLELSGLIEPLSSSGWQLRFSSRAGAADRAVSAQSCEELGEAAALWIALSIDPSYASRRGESTPANQTPNGAAGSSAAFADTPKPAPTAPPDRPRPEPSIAEPGELALAAKPTQPARTPTRLRWAVALHSELWLARLPGVAPGVGAFATLALNRLELGLGGSYFPSERAEKDNLGGDISLVSGRVTLGYELLGGALTPLLGVEFDWLRGSGTGAPPKQANSVNVLAADLGLRVRYTVRRPVRVFAQGYASVPFERPRFLRDDLSVFTLQPVGGSFGLGAEIELD